MIDYINVGDLVEKTINYGDGCLEKREAFLNTLPLQSGYGAEELVEAINDFPQGSREQKDKFINYLDIIGGKPRVKRTFTMEIEWDQDPRYNIHSGCGHRMAQQLLLGMKDSAYGFVDFAEKTNPTIKFVNMT